MQKTNTNLHIFSLLIILDIKRWRLIVQQIDFNIIMCLPFIIGWFLAIRSPFKDPVEPTEIGCHVFSFLKIFVLKILP